jgi:ABC-type multidrug transport system ATPase subunit
MTTAIVRAEALTKRYGSTLAVDRLDLSIEEGEVFGLLGPNGAGKTTTILMLLGLTEPTSGVARVAGFDPLRAPLEVKRRVGYMPDQLGFYDDLSGAATSRGSSACRIKKPIRASGPRSNACGSTTRRRSGLKPIRAACVNGWPSLKS